MYKVLIFIVLTAFYVQAFAFKKESPISLFEAQLKKKTIGLKKETDFYKTHLYFLKNNWDSTIFYSSKVISTKGSDKEVMDFCHYLRGFGFMKKQLYKEAEKEFELISLDFSFYYKVKFYLSSMALEMRNFEKALTYLKEIEKQNNTTVYDLNWSAVYHNMGICFLHLQQFKQAEKYLFNSTSMQELQKDSLLLVGSYMDLANLYYEQYKDDEAIPYFIKAYNLSKKVGDFSLKQKAAKNMAVVEENRKKYASAIKYRKEFEQWTDSINDQNKVWAIANLEKKFAVKQKQKEVDILATENKLKVAQRNGLLLSSILLMVFLFTGSYFYVQKAKTNKIILSQKNQLDELNATKDRLFSIVSHDLRSSVNALKTSNTKLMACLDSKNFHELDKLLANNSAIAHGAYNLLDNLLNWALLQTKQLYFHQESLHLHSISQHVTYNYKPLMLDKNIEFEHDLDKSIFVFADQDSLKIILRNLLDNAIKFSKDNGKIRVYNQTITPNLCELVVEDSGIGMNETTRRMLLKENFLLSKKEHETNIGTGLGLQLCKSMVKKNGGTLSIESQINIGTKIIVSMPKALCHG